MSADAGAARPLALLRELSRGQRHKLLLATVILVAATLVHLMVPLLLGSVVDAAIGAHHAGRLGTRIGLLVILAVAQAALSFAATVLFRAVAERMIVALRNRLFAQLVALPLSFHQGARSGELADTTSNDVAVLQQVWSAVPAQAIPAPLLLIGALVLMLRQSVALTLVIVAAAPLMVLAVRHFGARIRKASAIAQAEMGVATGTLQEALAGIETVQAWANEALHARRYGEQMERAYREKRRHILAEVAFSTAMGLATFCAFASALWIGGRLVIRGELSGGALVALLAYATYLQAALSSFTQALSGVQSARGALARPLALLALPVAPPSLPRGSERLQGDVRFEGVVFRHQPHARPAVAGVTLHIPRGRICALVGASGAGKTTLARLLFRFYEAERGRIAIGGVDITTVAQAELRRSLAYVPQDPILFTGTVRDNIRYGRDASDGEIETAARAAFAHDFIVAMPDGYDTRVGERGATLSGGQRQRIAIARALLADPAVLVLDEPTSALDAESDRAVQAALERLRPHRTTLIIAHRSTTIERADLVAVLDAGQLIELRRRAEPTPAHANSTSA